MDIRKLFLLLKNTGIATPFDNNVTCCLTMLHHGLAARREFHRGACRLQFHHVSESQIAQPHCSGILSQQRPALSGARELSKGVW